MFQRSDSFALAGPCQPFLSECQSCPAGITFDFQYPLKITANHLYERKTHYAMSTGKINVQTENIFPIIKKFLYSDHEIFLRELVSNAVDATQKLKALSSLGEFTGDLGDLKIEVKIDKENGTLTVSDR